MKNLDSDIKDKILDLIRCQLKRVDSMRKIVRNDPWYNRSYLTHQEGKLLDFIDYVKSDLSE